MRSRYTDDEPLPGLLYYLRLGVVDRIDLGLRLLPPVFGVDLKWNFVKTPGFDLALDAGVHYMGSAVYWDTPLIAGINWGPVSIVPSAGLSFARGEHPRTLVLFGPQPLAETTPMHATLLRTGLGIHWRIAKIFAIHPELTLLRDLQPGTKPAHVSTLGVAFTLGRLPERAAP
jgi:hypothetical protein